MNESTKRTNLLRMLLMGTLAAICFMVAASLNAAAQGPCNQYIVFITDSTGSWPLTTDSLPDRIGVGVNYANFSTITANFTSEQEPAIVPVGTGHGPAQSFSVYLPGIGNINNIPLDGQERGYGPTSNGYCYIVEAHVEPQTGCVVVSVRMFRC